MRAIRAIGAVLVCLLTLAAPAPASAHPLGNFTINRYARLELQPRQVRVYYVLDMAEIPTYQDMALIHAGGGLPADSERRDYLGAMVSRLRAGITADFDGQPEQFTVEPGSAQISYPPGQGNLPTTRIVAWFRAPLPAAADGATVHVAFRDVNFEDRVGWKEVVVRPLASVRIDQSTASTADQSDELRSYPRDMLSSPLDVRGARFAYRVVPGLGVDSPLMIRARGQSGGWLQAATDAFTNLISAPILSLRFVIVALLAAVALGGVHALSPGHGKTVVAAYLVGSRGTPKHALILGATVTVTHTAGVFALGLVTLFASRFIVPERLYPWISVLSGAMVAALGGWLFVHRLQAARRAPAPRHVHGAPRDRDVVDSARAGAGRAGFLHVGESSQRDPAPAAIVLLREKPPGAVAGGHTHAHPTDSEHSHAHGVAHLHDHRDRNGYVGGDDVGADVRAYSVPRPPRSSCKVDGREGSGDSRAHEQVSGHDHGAGWHTHAVPTPASISIRGLIALGISGGLLPCPSALVVLLAAISLQRVGFGIVLVLAFSIGLAGVLTGIGLLLVYSRGAFGRPRFDLGAGRFLPAASAFVVFVLGVMITLQALIQTGLVTISGA